MGDTLKAKASGEKVFKTSVRMMSPQLGSIPMRYAINKINEL
jgi:hypothetical protein